MTSAALRPTTTPPPSPDCVEEAACDVLDGPGFVDDPAVAAAAAERDDRYDACRLLYAAPADGSCDVSGGRELDAVSIESATDNTDESVGSRGSEIEVDGPVPLVVVGMEELCEVMVLAPDEMDARGL
ncbi:hypothetical protein PV04_08792 [Phialophora macrospora]|uniref:Uncharacterized protein n=1 Tax=Phialophora macrospora TaxID=1851006 RepID=A0A0D2FA64_9EURO|nr:hypothetical protein PV04_08792 [Phialophora macrospora]